MKQTLWTRDYILLTVATIFGSVGWIAGDFALSFLVFDETGSTFASALILAVQFIPRFFVPLFAAPILDRFHRKPFLVGGDLINGVMYTLAGFYLISHPFSYSGYLVFSLVLACLGCFDSLAYNSIYPNVIPKGMEQKGYAVSAMLYPFLTVLMTPLAAVLMDWIKVEGILIMQGGLSLVAALVESRMKVQEEDHLEGKKFSFALWKEDLIEGVRYIQKEQGLLQIFLYTSVSNGVAQGCAPLLVAFFRATKGFTVGMYAFFSVAEFLGRMFGGILNYRVKIPEKKLFGFCFGVYNFYAIMDMILLWTSYPFMLVNRAICGFLGVNSGTWREAAVQKYIPDRMRARVNAFQEILFFGMSSVLTLLVGVLGDVIDYRICMSVGAGATICVCLLTIWRKRKEVKDVYEHTAV